MVYGTAYGMEGWGKVHIMRKGVLQTLKMIFVNKFFIDYLKNFFLILPVRFFKFRSINKKYVPAYGMEGFEEGSHTAKRCFADLKMISANKFFLLTI